MPVISRFFGIIVYMYWRDHSPPHFHAKYGGQEVIVDIITGDVKGTLSKTAIALIQEWRVKHIQDLLEDWNLAEQKKQMREIPPLE
ncbi:DUF4160 domain-containing protein [Chitinispirillales bacterium ANBcel5]|uniref:DUF4160 domain-containing protein n=1 Tax=Cellulosispirillum alkaliphilum TaxID=3039283 RepID=UPI002A4FCE35|nr:DUF4160 domain-containing protein [Chitinispirillales bacterium ANBcel5]